MKDSVIKEIVEFGLERLKLKEKAPSPYIVKERFTKKTLRQLREEAKALGYKIEGKYGPEGKYHIYAVRNDIRRMLF